MLENTKSGLIAGVGVIVLLWSVIKLVCTIEISFNAIWKIEKQRSWARRIADYTAVLIFCPIIFIIASSLTVFLSTQLADLSQSDQVWQLLSPLMLSLIHFFPIVLSWILFTALYYVMPNIKVPIRFALIAGLLAASAFQLMQWVYIKFAIGLASYGVIYGSFAALPLFLLWLNTSWLIALAGAEVAYHIEDFAPDAFPHIGISYFLAERVGALLVLTFAAKRFHERHSPATIHYFAVQSGLSVTSLRRIVLKLIRAGLLIEVTGNLEQNGYYHIGFPLEAISLKQIEDAINSDTNAFKKRYPVSKISPTIKSLEELYKTMDEETLRLKSNYSLDRVISSQVLGQL